MAVLNDLDTDLIGRNMRLFREAMPNLGALLEGHRPQSSLVRNPDGDWDIEFRGQLLYGPGGVKKVQDVLDVAAVHPDGNHLQMAPLSGSNVDLLTERFLYKLLRRATDGGLEFSRIPSKTGGFHLICFGLGLGYQLPRLLEEVNPASICIVESNIDFLYHSLAVMDWQPIFDLAKKNPLMVSIIIASNAGEIAKAARQHIRNACPIMVDWTRVHQAYPSEQLTAAIAEFRRDAHLIGIGLGFTHDEMEMTRASYMNFKDGQYRLFKRGSRTLNVPAFIVGSGPSLDDDIEIIKELKDRVVIFSCGTASRVLLANGIEPDFQLLLENGVAPYRALKAVADEFSFGGATLIASNTVDPRVRSLFKNTVYYLRSALSSYAMFTPGPESSLEDSGPTVTNTGLSAALAMGFREVYLFGTDLGSRDPKRHHSKQSLYRHDDDRKEDQAGAMNFDAVFDTVDVGNFGGLIHTETIMTWTRDALGRVIGRYRPGAEVFNCSDGLLIENTRPKSSTSIRIKTSTEQKATVLTQVLATFPAGSREFFAERWGRADWRQNVRTLGQSVVDTFMESKGDLNGAMFNLSRLLLRDFERVPTFEEFFLRGTSLMVAMCFAFYVHRVQPTDREDEFWDIGAEEVTDIMRSINLQMEWFFDNIEIFESDEEMFDKLREWRYD